MVKVVAEESVTELHVVLRVEDEGVPALVLVGCGDELAAVVRAPEELEGLLEQGFGFGGGQFTASFHHFLANAQNDLAVLIVEHCAKRRVLIPKVFGSKWTMPCD